MNVSYEWLRAFVSFDETPAQLRDLVTARTATVEELAPLRDDLAPIVVARVVESQPIPDTKLTANKVDAGGAELLEVVCGAPNVAVGKLYPFAPSGTTMPDTGNKGGMKIERRKIRGFVSNGMLCSARELGLGEDADGIWELELDAAPGTPLLRALPVGDTRLVIDVLPNRPDLLSHLGVAREVAAVTGRPMALPPIAGEGLVVPPARRVRRAGRTGGIAVHLEEAELASRYMGVVVRGVTVGPSPEWLVRRLQSVGARSVNNVVDATNYVLHELGQPTHAFDLARLEAETVVIRRAKDGERLVTLDGTERILDASMTVIADAVRPVAVAGVMGGRESEVSDATTDLFLEVAVFDPVRTRGTRRALGLSTDASYRFERGMDPALQPLALTRLVQLVVALAGGTVDGEPVDLFSGETPPTPLALRVSRVARVLGDAVPGDEIVRHLRAVGFTADAEQGGEIVRVVAPSWRGDIAREVDLVEEVARLRGYDSFPDELRPQRPTRVPDAPDWLLSRRVREGLVGEGLLEVRPIPFVAGAEQGFVRVLNPLAENEGCLRREILDTLARRAEYNLAHMVGDVRIFEIGNVFAPGSGDLPSEELRVGALIMGRRSPAHFTDVKSEEAERAQRIDEWDAKALGERLAGLAYPGQRVTLDVVGGDVLWTIAVDGIVRGAVRRLTLDAPVWAAPAFGVEVALAQLSAEAIAPPGQHAHGRDEGHEQVARRVVGTYRPQPNTPPAPFDLALLVPQQVTAAQVADVITRAAGEMLERLELVDLYTGANLEPGHRSLAWRLTLRSPDRTLSGKEIEGRRRRITAALESELNVRPRSA